MKKLMKTYFGMYLIYPLIFGVIFGLWITSPNSHNHTEVKCYFCLATYILLGILFGTYGFLILERDNRSILLGSLLRSFIFIFGEISTTLPAIPSGINILNYSLVPGSMLLVSIVLVILKIFLTRYQKKKIGDITI